jgi:hypothetical protein
LIKRAAAAGAVAWTAPVIVESFASPAAAASGCTVTVTSLGTFTSTTDKATTYSAGPFNASTSGHTVLVLVNTHEAAASETLSVASGGPLSTTGTEIVHVTYDSKVDKGNQTDAWTLWAFRATASGSAGSFNISVPANTGKSIVVSVLQVGGENTAGPIASNPTGSGTSGNASVTFGAPASGNAQVVLVGNEYDPKKGSVTWSPPSGFTELTDLNDTKEISMETSWTCSGASSGTKTATPTVTDKAWGAIGLEINHA